MIIAMWIAIACALLAAGAGMTFLLGSALPAEFARRVQDHGRFAGLGAADAEPVSGKRGRAHAPRTGARTAGAV